MTHLDLKPSPAVVCVLRLSWQRKKPHADPISHHGHVIPPQSDRAVTVSLGDFSVGLRQIVAKTKMCLLFIEVSYMY